MITLASMGIMPIIDAFRAYRDEEKKTETKGEILEIRRRFIDRMDELTPDWLKRVYKEE